MQQSMRAGYAAAASMVPLHLITQGANPRTYFDPKEMAELEASVAVKGVMQPILIRPRDDGRYEIVAGERRFRAASVVGLNEIPAVIRQMTDNEADEAALVENIQRAPMSRSEEAKAAAKILGQCNNDREEAAKQLGWSPATLDNRLALMNCSDKVLSALDERIIKLGHAELLAAIPKEKQDGVLDKLLSAPTVPSPAQMKAQLQSIAKDLATAVFAKGECAACPHNSAVQGALFEEAIAAGSCTNGNCFDAKTMSVLDMKMTELRDDYPVVRIVNAGENDTLKPLKADGALGVGEEQARACRGCAKFGAAVSNIPGKLGQVYKDICFDPSCNANKVAVRIKAEKAAVEKPAAHATKGDAKTAAPAATDAAAKKDVKPAPDVQNSNRVKEYREKTWRSLYAKVAFAEKAKNPALLVAIALTGVARHISSTKMSDVFQKLSGEKSSLTNLLETARAIEAHPEVIETMTRGMAAAMGTDLEIRHVESALTFLGTDLAAHWKLNGEFLDLLTKSEIEAVCDEIGLKAHLGDQFSKVMGKKKDEIIKALLEVEGFEYQGKVPKAMQWKVD